MAYDGDLMEAMLVEATGSAGAMRHPGLASHDELLRFAAAGDPGDSNPPPPTKTATERCQRTCGGCRG